MYTSDTYWVPSPTASYTSGGSTGHRHTIAALPSGLHPEAEELGGIPSHEGICSNQKCVE